MGAAVALHGLEEAGETGDAVGAVGRLPAGTTTPFAVGIASAAVSGFAAIWFVLAYLKRNNFNLFVIYRIVVGVAILILIVSGVRSGMGI